MPAERIKLTDVERIIIDRVFLSTDGYQKIEDLLELTGADRNQFVDALESLEGHGYLAISNLGTSIIVAINDVRSTVSSGLPDTVTYSALVGQC